MRKMGVIAVICAVCLVIPLKGRGISLGMAQRGPRLTAQDAISVARRNAQKPGSSFTVLREIVANADTRRIGDQALEQARARKIKLYQNGILADVLRSGGFLLAETEPRTNNAIAFHLISLGSDGVPYDASYACDGVVKLADAAALAKDTTEFIEELYSTPMSEAVSLESRFNGGSFPEYGRSEEWSMFAVPRSLLKLGGDPNEVREAAALYGDLNILGFRYAVSMPTFAASPLAATQAAGDKLETLKAEFLRKNHMDTDFHFDLENIRSKKQLREQIDVLRRLDTFIEQALKNEADPALVKANISVATIPLGVVADTKDDQTHYNSGTGSLLVIYWQRLPAGGFAVRAIGEAG
jgi:hypothetical protein